MTTLQEKISIMQAAADGKKIQICYKGDPTMPDSWSTAGESGIEWNWGYYDYRVDPEVVKYRRYLYKSPSSGVISVYCNNYPLTSTPDPAQGFVRWIDNDWVEEVV